MLNLRESIEEETEPVDIAILYADGEAILKIETFKDGNKNYVDYSNEIEAKRRLRELKAEQAKLKQELNDLILKASLNEQCDVLIKYHNDLADIYEIKPYSCPICGKYPKSRYYKKDFHVWELYCCNIFGKTHFVSVGKPFRPYCEAVIEWNKHVEEVAMQKCQK